MFDIRDLFKLAIEKESSDIHLTVNSPPVLRIDGDLVLTNFPSLSSSDTKSIIYSVLNDNQKAKFEENLELDFSLDVTGLTRFRVNVHMQRGNVEAAMRIISHRVRTLHDLGMPAVVSELARRPNGLVLITGPTGVGKTTTLAAIVDLINNEKKFNIITIEDPIEYIHVNKKSIIKQREVYSDTKSFAEALKRALRQDPDVVVVGEMRDLETISTALTAAETGHLVLATLHTPNAPQTIDRIIDVFPPHQQQQIKIQLSSCIEGVVSQQLLPRADGKGRSVALEIMIATPAVRNLIREQEIEQIPTVLQTGSQYGMTTMDKSIKELYKRGIITYDIALSKMKNIDDFKNL